MAAALVQSNVGGSFSGSVASGAVANTSAAGFASATAAGNLLIAIVYSSGPGVANYEVDAPTTIGGYSGAWSQLNGSNWGDGTTDARVAIMYIAGAPAMSPVQTTTQPIQNHDTGSQTLTIDFDLYEFSGVNGAVNELNDSNDNQTGGTPGGIFGFSTADTDLIIAAFIAEPGSNISAGSGYTLGINSSLVTVGQMQYQLNAPPGQTAVSFSSTEPQWGCCYVSFQGASGSPTVTVTNVSPSSGPIAGGTAVTITGTDFLSGATVSFGGNAATSVVVVSSTEITCVTPAGSAGYVTVSVTDSDGTGSLPDGFLYTEPILDVSPSTLGFGAVLGGSNPSSQNVSVSNGDGGTLAWSVSSDESWLTASPTSGGNSNTVVVSASIAGLAVGTYTGHLTFSASGALDSPQVVTVTLTISSSGGGGGGGSEYMFVYFPSGTEVDFTPVFSPVAKQPEYQWGLEAKRVDSITASGLKQSVCERIDQVTTVKFPYVALSDMAAWKAFESYALGGGTFFYRPNIGWSDDTGYLTCAMVSMDWTPKFKSFQAFSLDMKLRLVAESFVGGSIVGDILLEDGGGIELESGAGVVQLG